MARFARIIELSDDQQVVLMKAWDDEEGMDTVEFHTDIDTMMVKTVLSFKEEVDRDHCFETYSDEAAQKFYAEMRNLILED